MKFAVDRFLEGRRYETDPLGPSLQRVLRYWTVRNKIGEARIHPDLREIGVTSIKVKEEGLVFERDNVGGGGAGVSEATQIHKPTTERCHMKTDMLEEKGLLWERTFILFLGIIGIILSFCALYVFS